MADEILLERSDGVATITLNRPEKKNALRGEDFDLLGQISQEVTYNTTDRVVVVTGAGDGFCSGADLTGGSGDGGGDLMGGGALAGIIRMNKIHGAAISFHRIPKPVIAAVNGVAAGAGCNLALACDIIYAADTARFTEIFAKRGLTLDFGGSYVLPRLIGLHKAKELAFTADIIGAADAERLGLVNKVLPAADLMDGVMELARRLAKGAPVPLALIKESLNRGARSGLEEALAFEGQAQAMCFLTEDTGEAMAAFVQKREPQFKGQ
jgi:2-(1,2-epoxy-1,2-dihydrophenyl)acetyl-CoA isomerase